MDSSHDASTLPTVQSHCEANCKVIAMGRCSVEVCHLPFISAIVLSTDPVGLHH